MSGAVVFLTNGWAYVPQTSCSRVVDTFFPLGQTRLNVRLPSLVYFCNPFFAPVFFFCFRLFGCSPSFPHLSLTIFFFSNALRPPTPKSTPMFELSCVHYVPLFDVPLFVLWPSRFFFDFTQSVLFPFSRLTCPRLYGFGCGSSLLFPPVSPHPTTTNLFLPCTPAGILFLTSFGASGYLRVLRHKTLFPSVYSGHPFVEFPRLPLDSFPGLSAPPPDPGVLTDIFQESPPLVSKLFTLFFFLGASPRADFRPRL